jgi:hypothetical protein
LRGERLHRARGRGASRGKPWKTAEAGLAAGARGALSGSRQGRFQKPPRVQAHAGRREQLPKAQTEGRETGSEVHSARLAAEQEARRADNAAIKKAKAKATRRGRVPAARARTCSPWEHRISSSGGNSVLFLGLCFLVCGLARFAGQMINIKPQCLRRYSPRKSKIDFHISFYFSSYYSFYYLLYL